MTFKNIIGQELNVGDYVARPTEYGASKVTEICKIVKINPKSIKVHKVSKEEPDGRTINGINLGVRDVRNYAECIVINEQAKKWFNT